MFTQNTERTPYCPLNEIQPEIAQEYEMLNFWRFPSVYSAVHHLENDRGVSEHNTFITWNPWTMIMRGWTTRSVTRFLEKRNIYSCMNGKNRSANMHTRARTRTCIFTNFNVKCFVIVHTVIYLKVVFLFYTQNIIILSSSALTLTVHFIQDIGRGIEICMIGILRSHSFPH